MVDCRERGRGGEKVSKGGESGLMVTDCILPNEVVKEIYDQSGTKKGGFTVL